MAIDRTEHITLSNEILKRAIKAPFNEKLGVKLVKAEKGRVILELDAKRDLANGLGIVHGGVTVPNQNINKINWRFCNGA